MLFLSRLSLRIMRGSAGQGIFLLHGCLDIVIPGHREAMGPESITTGQCASGAPVNE